MSVYQIGGAKSATMVPLRNTAIPKRPLTSIKHSKRHTIWLFDRNLIDCLNLKV
jgi:hypothetical protein